MAGGRRSSAAANQSSASPPLTAADLTSLLTAAAANVSAALRFVPDRDALLLLPSHSLALELAAAAAAAAVSRLLALLPLDLQTLTLTSLSLAPPPPAVIPSSSSSSCWFLRFVSSNAPPSAWLANFRMPRAAFHRLVASLSPLLTASSLAADQRVGAALFRLAHAAPFRAVARRFGLPSPPDVARAFYEVCRALAACSRTDLAGDLSRAVPGFCALSLPNCCGAVGFARFAAAGGITAQALVDASGRFLDVSAGWQASLTPPDIIPRTKLSEAGSVALASGPAAELIGGSVPRYFVGGSCCPLLPWLLTPFAGADSSEEIIFNNTHARAMEAVARAFATVRSQWRLLTVPWSDECGEALPYVVVSACLLHNFLVSCGVQCADDAADMDAAKIDDFPEFDGAASEAGERIREALAMHLCLVSQ